MPDYSKYTDKVTLNQSREKMDNDTAALFDYKTDEETQKIISKLSSNPHMLRSVATKLAQETLLRDTPKEDHIND